MCDSLPGLSMDLPISDNKSTGIKNPEIRVIDAPEIRMLDSVPTEWTDEKHSLYLNSMEASFVNQLYSSEYLSRDFLGWLSRTRKHTSSSGSSDNSLLPREFKVQRWGCWKKVKFERAKRRVDIENQSRVLSANPWIQHFRSSRGKEPDITSSKIEKELNLSSSYQKDNDALANQSIHLASPKHGREATSSKQLPSCFPHLYCQDSFGSNTEVSDQNFVDKEFERGEQSSRSRSKKRVRTSIAESPANDQEVVPHLEPGLSLFKDPELNDAGLNAE